MTKENFCASCAEMFDLILHEVHRNDGPASDIEINGIQNDGHLVFYYDCVSLLRCTGYFWVGYK